MASATARLEWSRRVHQRRRLVVHDLAPRQTRRTLSALGMRMRIAGLATPSTPATATRSGSSLALLNWPYRWVPLDILAGATHACVAREKPNGRIPTLQLEDGTCLAGSNAILGYLVTGHCLHAARSLGPRPGPAVDVLRALQPRAVRRFRAA